MPRSLAREKRHEAKREKHFKKGEKHFTAEIFTFLFIVILSYYSKGTRSAAGERATEGDRRRRPKAVNHFVAQAEARKRRRDRPSTVGGRRMRLLIIYHANGRSNAGAQATARTSKRSAGRYTRILPPTKTQENKTRRVGFEPRTSALVALVVVVYVCYRPVHPPHTPAEAKHGAVHAQDVCGF